MSVIMRNDIQVGGTDDDVMAKVGTAQLTTTSKDLSGAVNELNSSLGNLKVRFVNLFNAQTPFNIDIGFEPTGSRTAQILMYNANRGYAYMIKYETELGATKITTTSPDLTLSRSGSVLTITTSSRLWGVTTLMITEGSM